MSSNLRPVDRALLVESNRPLGASHYILTLVTQGAPELWEPGQFVMIATIPGRGRLDPILRRPFSIFNLPGSPAGRLQIFYKVLGRGTDLLSRVRPGDRLDCLWPLGNGFAPPRDTAARLLLVAGGIGSASLHPLAMHDRLAGGRPLVLYGCRTAADLAGILPTREAGFEVRVATDDGSAGREGVVSALLDEVLEAERDAAADGFVVCACGPMAMMKATAEVAARHGVACYVSLESPMACGFGVCVGCVVGTREREGAPLRYRRICVDGPVFDAAQVVW